MNDRRVKTDPALTGLPEGPFVGRLLHDLEAAPSADAGRWATIEIREPDMAANPVTAPDSSTLFAIVAVGSDWFEVAGDQTADLHEGFPIHVTNSTPNSDGRSNDGPYIVKGGPTYSSPNTRITIDGVLPDSAITDGHLTIVPPWPLKSTGRVVLVVSRSNVTAAAGTFVKATPLGWEHMIDVINCGPEED